MVCNYEGIASMLGQGKYESSMGGTIHDKLEISIVVDYHYYSFTNYPFVLA